MQNCQFARMEMMAAVITPMRVVAEMTCCHQLPTSTTRPPQALNAIERANRAVRYIGATGFEPATFWSQTRRSTKLSYAPEFCKHLLLNRLQHVPFFITSRLVRNCLQNVFDLGVLLICRQADRQSGRSALKTIEDKSPMPDCSR